MLAKKYLTKVITGAVVLSLMLSVGISAFASQAKDAAEGSTAQVYSRDGRKGKGQIMGLVKGDKGFTALLPELVADGTLSQGESDKITEYAKEKREARKAEMDKVKTMTTEERKAYMAEKKNTHQDLLSELVSKGILTQAKADAVKEKMQQKHVQEGQARVQDTTEKINKLADSGTITKEQASKVIEEIKKNVEEKRALGEKLKTMTTEERKANMEKNKGQRTDLLKKMVEDNTLTQEQATAIRNAIKPERKK
jgi:polyhydroxyalkanoate synthesis regulator phasin